MKGIDISNNNTVTSFSAIKAAGYEIVYLKATEGLSFTDSKMREYYNAAKSAGLKVGFYHFMHSNDSIAEAKHFLSAISGLDSDCLYMLDVEAQELSKLPWDTSNKVVSFCEYLKSECKQVGVYTYKSFWDNVLKGNARNYPLWIANYGASNAGVSSYVGWQYSETGIVSGAQGHCDVDIFTDGILIKKPTQTVQTPPPLQQPNNFCKTVNKNSKPILDDFLTIKEHILCKSLPDNNSATNGDLVTLNRPVHIYGKCGIWYLVNNINPQYVAIEWFKASNPLKVIKQVKVINANGGYCRENPSPVDVFNGIVPTGKTLNVYKELNNFYLVNGENEHLQWIDKDDCVDL